MLDRSAKEMVEGWVELVDPLRRDPVLTESLELAAHVRQLLLVGEPQAAGAAKRVPRELLHPLEIALGETPELAGALHPELVSGHGVRPRATPARQAAVA